MSPEVEHKVRTLIAAAWTTVLLGGCGELTGAPDVEIRSPAFQHDPSVEPAPEDQSVDWTPDPTTQPSVPETEGTSDDEGDASTPDADQAEVPAAATELKEAVRFADALIRTLDHEINAALRAEDRIAHKAHDGVMPATQPGPKGRIEVEYTVTITEVDALHDWIAELSTRLSLVTELRTELSARLDESVSSLNAR